jgi:hypothetical protein
MSLSATKLWRDINKNLEHLLGLSYRVYFWVFTLSVRVKYFEVDLDGMENDCAYSQCRNSTYVGGVYVILILRA